MEYKNNNIMRKDISGKGERNEKRGDENKFKRFFNTEND